MTEQMVAAGLMALRRRLGESVADHSRHYRRQIVVEIYVAMARAAG